MKILLCCWKIRKMRYLPIYNNNYVFAKKNEYNLQNFRFLFLDTSTILCHLIKDIFNYSLAINLAEKK